jgi:outer membrane receptor protein involved in Fe transport
MRFAKTPTALAVSSLLAFSLGVQAQQASTPPADTKAKDAPVTIERVTVTGSRVFRAGFDTLEPATVVTRASIEDSGVTNVADALRTPGFGAGATPEGGQAGFGTGVNFVNRFGLGSNRTLSLINGRRVVSSNPLTIFGPAGPGGQVDLNIIPTNIVERIENLAIGGAPTYGSDAIAGVVNVITRRSYDGFEVNGTTGMSQQGDGRRGNYGVLFGKNFADDRANLTLSYVYDNQDGVLASARDRGQLGLSLRANPCLNGASSIATTQPNRTPQNDGRLNPDTPFQTCLPTSSSDGRPDSVYITNDRNFTMTPDGLLFPATGAFNLADGRLRGFGPAQTTYFNFNSAGALVPYNPGINFGTTNASGGDGFPLFSTTQITSKVERRTINVLSSFRLTDSIDLFYEGLFYKAEALELVDQTAYNSNLFGGTSGPITFASTYPLLSPAAVGTLQANGITSFRVSRLNRDLAVNNGYGSTELARSVVGARGDFVIGTRPFNWEVSANYGKNESIFLSNVLNQQNFVNALNVTRNAAGNVVCSTTPTPGLIVPGGGVPKADPNCVPLSLFGDGAASAAAKAYVTGQTTTRSTIEQKVLNANVGGSLFNTWGGPVGVNVGLETRTESAAFIPDDFQTAGLGRAVAIIGSEGSYSTKEIFGEMVLPLVDAKKNITLLNKLDLTAKFRRVDSTVNGGANTYTYGLQFKPVQDVEFRGNVTRALRAPALVELFTPVSNIFTAVPDPCDSRNIRGGTAPALRAANCAPFYTQYSLNPSTFISNAVNATIPGTLQGSTTLKNEQSDAKNIGMVIRPRALKNLRMSVDYYEIKIIDTISNLNAAAIATGCYDNPNQANSFCGRIARDSTGQITGITTGFVNGGTLEYKGGGAEIQYSADLKDLYPSLSGVATVGLAASKLYSLQTSANNVTITESVGTLGFSQDQAQLTLGYEKGPMNFSLQGNFTGAAKFSNTESPETRDVLAIDSSIVWSGGFGYKFNKKTKVNFAVTNLFNQEPPMPLTATGGAGVYDILGRRYSVTVNHKFW